MSTIVIIALYILTALGVASIACLIGFCILLIIIGIKAAIEQRNAHAHEKENKES